MNLRRPATALLAAATLSAVASAVAAHAYERRPAINTRADYTPVERFQPLPASTACADVTDAPFLLPSGNDQQVVAQEGEGGTTNLWDMNTQNEHGQDAGRYVYRTHETAPSPTAPASAVSVTDLQTGTTTVLAQRADWENFDGIVWTPHGTLLAAEETGRATVPDPVFSNARAGLVYELFVDPHDPSRLRTDDPRDDVAPFDDGIAARPALGSKAHEGMRFDRRGYHYGITESNPGSIFRFVPDRPGDMSKGHLQVLKTDNGHDGTGTWVEIPDTAAGVDAQPAATAVGANTYNRPEDVETGQSTGVDRNNGANTLYVAVTGTDEVLAVDLTRQDRPYAYDYVFNVAHSQTSSGPRTRPPSSTRRTTSPLTAGATWPSPRTRPPVLRAPMSGSPCHAAVAISRPARSTGSPPCTTAAPSRPASTSRWPEPSGSPSAALWASWWAMTRCSSTASMPAKAPPTTNSSPSRQRVTRSRAADYPAVPAMRDRRRILTQRATARSRKSACFRKEAATDASGG